jgi:hypothetical protein
LAWRDKAALETEDFGSRFKRFFIAALRLRLDGRSFRFPCPTL